MAGREGKRYKPGDIGRIVSGPEALPDDPRCYYLVAVDKLTFGLIVLAAADIEPDVLPRRPGRVTAACHGEQTAGGSWCPNPPVAQLANFAS